MLPVRLEGPIKVEAEVKATMVGDNGKSAYEIAVAHGYKGTEQEWLDSLKGLQGPQGEPGLKGAPFRYEDFTPEQLEALKGPKGDKGNPFVYADFTTEQLEALKGPKGDKGEDGRDGASATVDNAHQLLLQGNVWCESASVDDVLTALIGNISKPFPRSDVKPLTFTQPQKGDTILFLQGEDHYKVSLEGGELVEVVNGSANITIPAYGKSDIVVDYFNMLGVKVSNITITGINELQFTDKNGITVFKEGNVLTIDLTNQTDNIDKNYDISDRPAWVYDGVTEFKFISNSPNKIIGYAETSKIPIDNLYATLNTIGNPNIKTIYAQYGEIGKMTSVLMTRRAYRSVGDGASRKVIFLGQQNIRTQVELERIKADYFAVMSEPFNGYVAGFGDFYKTAPDNE
ncbi:collagen-like protein [Veillonella atypica]|uniref:collagen-like triple helix repeat-containing protein n=1 Tax=Veillonella atypica TaxID=39777 RepID=UPI001E50532F|nr:collagen-like protein [Veillonella atypica]